MQFLNIKSNFVRAVDTNLDEIEKETRCGIGFLKSSWLQKLASKKSYVLFYGISGSVHFALSAYFVATISTIEKRFQIPSKFSGILIFWQYMSFKKNCSRFSNLTVISTKGLINASWDFGSIFTTLVVSYLGRSGHKPRWVAGGTALVGLSCFMRLIPHWLYGPGENSLLLTREFGTDFRPLNLSDNSGEY
jgi:Organic Anion Transporter Polypeptide (OATP) family